MDDIFFHKAGKGILLCLYRRNNQYITEISASVGGTYAHTFNLIREMESAGIVSSTKKGRTKFIKLTEKGKSLAMLAREFESTLKEGSRGIETVKITPTYEKLERYRASLATIHGNVKSAKPKKRDVIKYARLMGRYKSLILKLRPKDQVGKDLKLEALAILSEINSKIKR